MVNEQSGGMGVSAAARLSGYLLAACLAAAPASLRAENPPLASVPADSFADKPAGIRWGGLLYNATITTGAAWDSNIFFSRNNVVSDRIVYIKPGLTVSTLDPNYKFTFRAQADHFEYDNTPAESRTNGRAEVDGTIRLRRDLEVDVGASAGHVREPRSLQRRDLPEDAAEPVAHNIYTARLAVRRIFNSMLTTTTAVGVENDNYFNVRSNGGGIIDLQFLDRDLMRASQETELKISHRLKLFSNQRVVASDYREGVSAIDRDSVKFVTVNGIEVVLTPLVKVRAYFHYGNEHFRDATIEADPERIYGTEVTWSPRRNIKLRAAFSREFGGVSFDLDATGGRRSRVELGLDYEITRRLHLRTSFHYVHANEAAFIAGTDRIEDTYVYKASLGYHLNRIWTLTLDGLIEKRDSTIPDNSFDRFVVQAGATARF